MIVQVIVMNRTVVDSDWCFKNLCSSHLRFKLSCIKSVDLLDQRLFHLIELGETAVGLI